MSKEKTISYLGVHEDLTGYSQAGTDYCLASDSVGLNIYPLTLHLNNANNKDLPERFKQLQNKKQDKPADVVIQHYLPSLYQYMGGVKNIGLFAWETDRLPLEWVYRINNMVNEVWVINQQQKLTCLSSGVKKPIRVVPHTINVKKFQRSYEQLDEVRNVVKDSFLFYTVCEFGRRKNLEALLRAFHTEFEPNEPVELLLKINKSGLDSQQLSQMLGEFCKTVKENIKKFNNLNFYKKDITITNNVNELNLMRLHSTCDCFVSTSFGEAWSLPLFDGLGLGKSIIAPRSTGFVDYLNDDCAWLIDTNLTPCFGSDNPLYSYDQNWWALDINHLRECMREVYEYKQLRDKKSKVALKRVYDFSYEKIGNLIKSLLDG